MDGHNMYLKHAWTPKGLILGPPEFPNGFHHDHSHSLWEQRVPRATPRSLSSHPVRLSSTHCCCIEMSWKGCQQSWVPIHPVLSLGNELPQAPPHSRKDWPQNRASLVNGPCRNPGARQEFSYKSQRKQWCQWEMLEGLELFCFPSVEVYNLAIDVWLAPTFWPTMQATNKRSGFRWHVA